MADTAPLVFEARLGGLFPANRVAEEAMREIRGRVTVKITGGIANQRRRSLYWVLCGIVTELLNQRHNMTLTENDLHDIIRDKLGMYDAQTLPSGEVHKRYRSTSNRAMNEADRSVFTNKALAIWSTWCGVPVETLRREGENNA